MRALASFVVLAAAAAAATPWKIPVYDKTPFQAVEEYGSREKLDVLLFNGAEKDLRALSCADVDRAPNSYGLPAATTDDMQVSGTVKNECAELRLLLSAKAPKTPVATDFSKSPLDEFPPCFAPVLKSAPAVDVIGKTWRSSSKSVEVKAESDHTLFVRDPENAWSSVVRLVGRADFNGDGVDDVLLRNAWKLADGVTTGVSHLVLSRKPGAAVHRVVFDSSGRCQASMPAPAVCSPETIVRMRKEFQRRYDAKEYASAYEFLDSFHEACRNRVSNVPRDYWGMRWIANDLAITAHHLGRDARCLELTRDAAFQDAPKGAEKFAAAVAANTKLCESSLRCNAKKIGAARAAFEASLGKNDVSGAIATLRAFADDCEGSADPVAIALAYTDLAAASKQAGDLAACSAFVDRAERLSLDGEGDDVSAALSEIGLAGQLCPRPGPVPVSTPITAAPWAGSKPGVVVGGGSARGLTLTWLGHCEGDPLKAKIVERKDAAAAQAPFCVRLDKPAWDPLGMNSAEVEVPGWDSMQKVFLLIETTATEPVTVKVVGEKGVPKCTECDGGCAKLASRQKFSQTWTESPKNGRVVVTATSAITDWHLVSVALDATVTQNDGTAMHSVALSGWAWCM